MRLEMVTSGGKRPMRRVSFRSLLRDRSNLAGTRSKTIQIASCSQRPNRSCSHVSAKPDHLFIGGALTGFSQPNYGNNQKARPKQLTCFTPECWQLGIGGSVPVVRNYRQRDVYRLCIQAYRFSSLTPTRLFWSMIRP